MTDDRGLVALEAALERHLLARGQVPFVKEYAAAILGTDGVFIPDGIGYGRFETVANELDATLARLRAIETAARNGLDAFDAWARGERDEWGAEHDALRAALREE
jgi:hypothetical protein